MTAALLAAHQEFAPHLKPNTGPISRPISEEAEAQAWAADMGVPSEFGDVDIRHYRSERTLSGADYVAYLSTQSAYRILDEDVRERLFGSLRNGLGTQVKLDVETVLHLARHLP